jgi:MFS family permease
MVPGTTMNEYQDGVPEQSSNGLSGIRLQLMLLGTPLPHFHSPLCSCRPELTPGAFRFTEAIAWTSIFPYVYFMIETFPEIAEVDIAFYAGLLVATFTFCEFLTAMIWAKISNLIGRKYTLLIGILGGVVSAVTFGLSKSIVVAVVSRAIGGLMNPNVGIVQTCVGELAKDKEQQGSTTTSGCK